MFISNREKEAIKRDSNNLWNNVSILEKARQSLFIQDRHGTERPKVDMLTESMNRSEFSIWQSIRLINARLKVLEKKCKIK